MKIGVITGSVFPSGLEFEDPMKELKGSASTGVGRLEIGDHELVIIARHGDPPRIPPHRIDHRANLELMIKEEVTFVVSVCSSGSLKRDIKVPSLMIPHDYIDLFSGATVFDDEIIHITPGFSGPVRQALITGARNSRTEVIESGVYVQTRGPRLETKAEVRMLSSFGDVVGMNLGSESTIAAELGMPLAGIATIDNYAHGVMDEELDYRDILTSARSKWDAVRSLLISVPDAFHIR